MTTTTRICLDLLTSARARRRGVRRSLAAGAGCSPTRSARDGQSHGIGRGSVDRAALDPGPAIAALEQRSRPAALGRSSAACQQLCSRARTRACRTKDWSLEMLREPMGRSKTSRGSLVGSGPLPGWIGIGQRGEFAQSRSWADVQRVVP